ncbi:hypothetical protein [Spirillospora sp. NPDC029432]|uniref:hypothetical protein n=1 Tax=Spirillospora sp. NPDC029432 TaxID=3154599 RepID=UPI003456E4DE
MDDYVVSLIRTWVPVAVGAGLTWLAAETGLVLDEDAGAAASTLAVALVIALYYAAARAIEQRWPRVGRIMLALGLRRTPRYETVAKAVKAAGKAAADAGKAPSPRPEG